eukprot:m.783192 g.783192  ORF g.783192 m.783192 type:complete len:635 (+) comp59153_c0_seq5:146-2050(+)
MDEMEEMEEMDLRAAAEELIQAVGRGQLSKCRRLLSTHPKSIITHPAMLRTALHETIYHGKRVEILALFLTFASEINLNAVDYDHRCALSVAVRHQRFEGYRMLVAAGADLYPQHVSVKELFFHAVAAGDVERVDELLRNEPALNNAADVCARAVATAAGLGKLAMLRHLLSLAPFREYHDQPATSRLLAVSRAVAGGHLDCLELLAGDDKELPTTLEKGDTLLHIAAKHGHPGMLRRLLSFPSLACLINHQNEAGLTPVAAAVEGGSTESLEMLRASSGDLLRAVPPRLGTALHLAATNGRAEMLLYLLESHLFDDQLDRQDECEDTPLSVAAAKGRLECVRILLARGADYQNETGWTVLHSAAALDDLELFDLLFESGARNIDAQDEDGETPLYVASAHRKSVVLQRLLSLGANPSILDSSGSSALHRAARAGHLSMLRMLLEKCTVADINVQDVHGSTPFRLSIGSSLTPNSRAVANLLLSHGADIHYRDLRGMTIKRHAQVNNLGGLLEFLEEHEEFLANLGSRTKPALRNPVAVSAPFEAGEQVPQPPVVNLLEMPPPSQDAHQTDPAAEKDEEPQRVDQIATTTSTTPSTATADANSIGACSVPVPALQHLDLSDVQAELAEVLAATE